ncbi:atypical chemokine receptor 4 isoform X1 [Brienomyrus brachyistius]|uniref:atypical chemokine receptor 4 isoform X1 n=2 Tax=Brienomyrus brachyistius TaxID=42636 RepID=UPI0020B31B97|nr:atypical chemokine receptor 4 isoform X1 [Brienomyrus brachyistius]
MSECSLIAECNLILVGVTKPTQSPRKPPIKSALYFSYRITMVEYEYYDHDNGSDNFSYEDYHTVCQKEDVRSFARIFLPIIYSLALVVGLAGNAVVVAIYAYYKKLKTMTDVFILNLAVADLLLLFTLPFWAANAVVGWELGVAMCKVTSSLYVTNFSCGMLFLACISVDRYLAIFHSRPGRTLQRRSYLRVCLGVWALAFILGIPDVALSTVRHMSSRKVCMPVYPPSMAQPTKASLEILEVLLSFLLPFLVMLLCYTRVGVALLRTPEARLGKKWRAFKVLLAVVGAFIITQLPYNVVKFCRAMDVIYSLVVHCETSKRLDRAMQVTEGLALTHSCLNPVLYAFVGASFSQHLLQFVKGFGERRRRRKQEQEPAPVEISLNSHSTSEDTSTFSI